MNYKDEEPDNLEGLCGLLPAKVRELMTDLLEQLYQVSECRAMLASALPSVSRLD